MISPGYGAFAGARILPVTGSRSSVPGCGVPPAERLVHRVHGPARCGATATSLAERRSTRCCHGFPESWYSWRHQLLALAEAGFRAVAPDMRGYGGTDQPPEIDQYTLLHSIGDMVGLLDVLGVKQAVIVGHDWGAPMAWAAAVLRPDRFAAL
jgi:pimeloyl-ACP methyl ester carboxylesterase